MAKIRRLKLPEPPIEERSLSPNDAFELGIDFLGGHNTSAGRRVNVDTAMQVTTVFGCLRVLGDGVGTLPMDYFQRLRGVKRPYRPKPRWLNFDSGPWNRIDVMSQIMSSLNTNGNSYLATYRRPNGEVLYVEPLNPDVIEPERRGQEIIYRILQRNGTYGELDQSQIKHIPGMMLPGSIKGVSPITYARETIGMALAAEEFGATFFGNGSVPGIVVEMDPQVNYSENARKDLKLAIDEGHRGSSKAHKTMVLTQGAKAKPWAIPAKDAEYLANRKFQVPQIAMCYGVPPHRLGVSDAPQFGSTVAEDNQWFAQHTLRAWSERIEQGLTDVERYSRLTPSDAFVSLSMKALLRGDYTSRVNANSMMVREGIMTINEARAEEDLPPVPWGDKPISVQVQGTATQERSLASAILEVSSQSKTRPRSPQEDQNHDDD